MITDFQDLDMPDQEDYILEAANAEKVQYSETSFESSERYVLYGILVAILVVNFAVLWFVRSRMKRQMNAEINQNVSNVVNQYFALSSSSDGQP